MSFKCDACGKVADVPQFGAADGASVSNDGSVPKNWRTIFTVIESHDGKGGMSTTTSELLHSCDDCNANMTEDEHADAEFESRKFAMRVPPKPNPPKPARAAGGRARAAKLTPERRSEIARKAARTRWAV